MNIFVSISSVTKYKHRVYFGKRYLRLRWTKPWWIAIYIMGNYTAVSVWLWDESLSTSISGIVSSSGTLSAYSMEDVWERRLLSEDCFRRTSVRVGFIPSYLVSRPCRKALTTRICKNQLLLAFFSGSVVFRLPSFPPLAAGKRKSG